MARTARETYYTEVAEGVVAHTHEGLVLDVGTGPGYLPIEIAKRAPEIRVVGIDSSKALLQIAQTNAERAGVSDRVRFMKADANRLGFENDLFDLVISTGSLHAWKNPIRIINECFRVLKAGCEAWFLDPAQIVTPEAQQLVRTGLRVTDRLAYWWGSFTSQLTPPYSVSEIREIIGRTEFRSGDVTEGKWLTVKLRKHAGPPTEAVQRQPDKSSEEFH
jgi:ubiquinone/menaquinone biosynthesis C-methylase UbiE